MKMLDKTILASNIDKRINADIADGKVAGASVCVIQDGHMLCRKFYGYSDAETKEVLTEKNLYRMASMTKPVTAVCI